LSVGLTSGNVNDTLMLGAALTEIRIPRRGPGRPRTRPNRLLGDKGYSSAANRRTLARRGIAVTIPERADQLANRKRRGSAGGRPYAFDPKIYKRRNIVERCFNRFKQWRGTATRYDKKAVNYRARIVVASVILWLKT
jgi:transposase